MEYNNQVEFLMEKIKIYVASDLLDQLEDIIRLNLTESLDLHMVRQNILTEIKLYIAPLFLEKVNILIRKFMVDLKSEEDELFALNEADSSEEEEDGEEETNIYIKPKPVEETKPSNEEVTI